MPTTEPHYRPWGVVTPDFWNVPAGGPPRPPGPPATAKATDSTEPPPATPRDPGTIPPELLPAVREINRALNARRLPEAATLAASAEAHISATYGESHVYTANIRALQAFITERTAAHPR